MQFKVVGKLLMKVACVAIIFFLFKCEVTGVLCMTSNKLRCDLDQQQHIDTKPYLYCLLRAC